VVTAGDIRARRRAQTRAEILDAAWELARRDGVAALSLRELAERVGMRAPSLYTYFASKNDLYSAMYAQGMQQFAEAMEATGRGRSAHHTLRNRATTFVRTALADPVRYELLFHRPIPGFVPAPPALAIGLSTLATTRAVAEAAGLRGERAFDLFMATSRGLIAMQIANEPGGERWARLMQEAVDILVAHYATDRPTGASRRRARGSV